MKRVVSAALAALTLSALPLAANATIYQFNANISGASEVPVNPSPANGVATLFYDDKGSASFADDTYDFSMSVFGLTGPITGAHIHAPAPVGVNAAVVVTLNAAPFVVFNSGGALLIGGSDVSPPYASFLSQLQAGLAYVNVHTALNPNGETRGQLFQVAVSAVPEPATYGLLLAGLAGLGFVARRRSDRDAN